MLNIGISVNVTVSCYLLINSTYSWPFNHTGVKGTDPRAVRNPHTSFDSLET